MSEPRVLLVLAHSGGGIGVHVRSLARGLAALGVPVRVFTSPQTAARFDFEVPTTAGWTGSLPGRVAGLRAAMGGVDVVHAHGHQAGVLAVLAARTIRRAARPRVAITWHNAVLATGARRLPPLLAEALQARAADLVAGASSDLTRHAARLGARVAVDAPVASDLPPPEPVARPPRPDRLTVLTVSRVAPQKGLDVLVEAAARLPQALADACRSAGVGAPGWRWLLAGDGDPALTAELRSLRDRRGATVELLGRREDVAALLAQADLFVLTSRWEARALVVQEALAAGLPVVSTDVGGLRDLLHDLGRLVPPGDPGAVAAAVAQVLTELTADPGAGERMATAARGRAAELPAPAQVVTEWWQRYRQLAGR